MPEDGCDGGQAPPLAALDVGAAEAQAHLPRLLHGDVPRDGEEDLGRLRRLTLQARGEKGLCGMLTESWHEERFLRVTNQHYKVTLLWWSDTWIRLT